MFDLTYMSRGNKACMLLMITTIIMVAGSFMFALGGDGRQQTGKKVEDDNIFTIGGNNTGTGNNNNQLMPDVPAGMPTITPTLAGFPEFPNIDLPGQASPLPQPIIIPTPPPIPAQLPPTNPPVTPIISTPFPITPMPTPQPLTTPPQPQIPPPQPQPQPGVPIIDTSTLPSYPFAVVFECDWNGERLSATTKTASSSVIRLCIEPPIIAESAESVEVSYLNWFVFTRQPYENLEEPLPPITQYAVILGRADPFGLTVLNCPPGTPSCKLATNLRPEFFTHDAFLLGRGELILQYTESKAIAGKSPVSIYFLLSATDIQEPLQLGRRAEPIPDSLHDKSNNNNNNNQKVGGRLGQSTGPLFLNKPP